MTDKDMVELRELLRNQPHEVTVDSLRKGSPSWPSG